MRILFFVAAALVGSITGTIRTDQGRPAANVVVSVEGSPVSVRTDGSGRFTIAGVPLGDQKIRIQAEGHTDVVLPVPVAVADDRAIWPDGIAEGVENALRATHDLAHLAQCRVHEHRVARLESDRAKISREAGAGCDQLVAPA